VIAKFDAGWAVDVNFVLLAGFFADPAKGMVDFILKKQVKLYG